jgi:AcrR family transcriptional regulator
MLSRREGHRVSDEGSTELRRGRPRDPRIEVAVLRAAHNRLVTDGYARLTIGEVAADAGVSRPSIYRRWPSKQDLVMDALDYAFRTRQSELAALDLDRMSPRNAVIEAVKRLYGRTNDGRGIRVVAKVLAEADQTPGLLDMLRQHALRPRRELFLQTLRGLQTRKKLRPDVDLEVIVDMCVGGYFSAYLMTGDDDMAGDAELSARLVDALWPYLQGPAKR